MIYPYHDISGPINTATRFALAFCRAKSNFESI